MRAIAPIEPRFFPRAALTVAARIACGDRTHEATVVNISEGGALVLCTAPLPNGATVQLEFELPGAPRPISVLAAVVRAGAGETDGAVGLRFGDVSEAVLVAIRAFVEQKDPTAWDGGLALPRDMAVRFVPVIRRQAYRMARRLPAQVQVDDLVGAGFLALVEAYARFDPAKCSRFEPYALMRIRGGMLDEVRGSDPVSRGMRRLKREVDAAALRLQNQLGRPPDDDEIASHVGLSIEDYQACLAAVSVGAHASLDDMANHGESLRPPSQQSDFVRSAIPDPEHQAGKAETVQRVEVALSALPPRLRQVLEMYYGQELTLRDIGTILGVTEGRISQLISQAVGRLRSRVAHDGDS